MYSLLVHTLPEERRVALVEGRVLRELRSERRFERGIVGNIYLGRIVRVMQGLHAAFVEIGTGRAGFLQWEETAIDRGDEDPEESPETLATPEEGVHPALALGEDVLVQVTREAFGSKGPRLSRQLSLPGRTLVFLPMDPLIGISRRIPDPDERRRLREAIAPLLPPGTGAIVRTASQGRPAEELADDLAFLQSLWDRIQAKARESQAPALLHEDLDLLLRSARDHLGPECDEILVDTVEDHDRLLQFVDTFMPRYDSRIRLYDGPVPLFDHFGIEGQVSSLLDRTVWLKSGGSIVFDHTEALTAIDVNTGGGSGRQNSDETILMTNLEAAREIAAQLRLRDIGGIIVIDFVDMRDPSHRQQVQEELLRSLATDSSQWDVLPMSRLGLVEMTRKRSRETFRSRMTETCPCCGGRGFVRSVEASCGEIVRRLARTLAIPSVRGVRVDAHPRVIEGLVDAWRLSLADLETRWQKPVRLVRREDLPLEQWTLRTEG
ncbi:MAG TPA: Rne/Rng family ribonuclease [Myxococcota bacterium]|nr:Rne/Rng family ribonuclease [Myxococcota bacterium]HQK50704.1 Rne/Rng family ribonuclease [Myxococcota bacterium]